MTIAEFEEVIALCVRCERDEAFARDLRSAVCLGCVPRPRRRSLALICDQRSARPRRSVGRHWTWTESVHGRGECLCVHA